MSETQKVLNYRVETGQPKSNICPVGLPYQIQMNVVQNASQGCSLTLHCSIFCPGQLCSASCRKPVRDERTLGRLNIRHWDGNVVHKGNSEHKRIYLSSHGEAGIYPGQVTLFHPDAAGPACTEQPGSIRTLEEHPKPSPA